MSAFKTLTSDYIKWLLPEVINTFINVPPVFCESKQNCFYIILPAYLITEIWKQTPQSDVGFQNIDLRRYQVITSERD